MCHSGKTLSIKASGNFKEKIEEGAKVHLQVKYGLITLINQENDLCDALSNVDLKCPLEKGEMSLTKDVDLPAQIPPVCSVHQSNETKQLMHYRGSTLSSPTSSPRTVPRSPALRPRFSSRGKHLQAGRRATTKRNLYLRLLHRSVQVGKRKFSAVRTGCKYFGEPSPRA
jgi:hypothetical protein